MTITLEPGQQIIKSRDDHKPVLLLSDAESEDGRIRFKLPQDSACTWAKPGESFEANKELRPRIEPWLTALFQSDHFNLLAGSGLTHSAHFMATDKPLPGMTKAKFSGDLESTIEKEVNRIADATGRGDGNIEDQIRVANELRRGLEILAATDANQEAPEQALADDLKKLFDDFAKSILSGELGLVASDTKKREETFNYLVSFLMSFASRTGTRDRLQIFTTNYDRVIETAAELAGLHLLDRFVGTIAPILRSSRLDVDMHYNPPGIRGEPRYLEGVTRFTKLHGSVDWVDHDKSIRRIGLPFGAEDVAPYLNAPGLKGADSMRLMIYPNAAKDRETAAYPYVELFRDFAAAVCRPNSALVTYGYSFGDEHINRVIEDMLTIPSTHLVVIAYNDPLGRIMKTYEKLGRPAQITLLLGNHLGDLKTLVDHYLPKPAIDRTTFRMAELLNARWNVARPKQPQEGAGGANEGEAV